MTKIHVYIYFFQALTFQDGNLIAGSLEALIQHLVPTTEYNPDVSKVTNCSCQSTIVKAYRHIVS